MLSTFELLDGTLLVIEDSDLPHDVAAELEVWALVPDEDEDPGTNRDPSVWAHALEAGPLALVVFQGVVGNAAWAPFPAAAAYLRAKFAQPAELDASAAAERALKAVESVMATPRDQLVVESAARDGNGCWTCLIRLPGGDGVTTRLDVTGTMTSIVRF